MAWTGNNGDIFNAGRIGIQGGQDEIHVRTDPVAFHFRDMVVCLTGSYLTGAGAYNTRPPTG